MRYPEAKAQARSGKGVLASLAGGRKRYAMFTLDDEGTVRVRLFQTEIIAFYPDGRIRLDSGGYHTPSTFDAMHTVYGDRPYRDVSGALCLGPVFYGDGMVLGPGGNVLEPGKRSLVRATGIRVMPRYTKTICYGVDEAGNLVSKLGISFAWPVLDFASMTPDNGFAADYDLQLVPDREVSFFDQPKSVRKDAVPPDVRKQHETFWKALTP